MYLTLNEVLKHHPCKEGWKIVIDHYGKDCADDEPIHIMKIVELLGAHGGTWMFRLFDYKVYCGYLADIIDTVSHLYTKDDQVKDNIEKIRYGGLANLINVNVPVSASDHVAMAVNHAIKREGENCAVTTTYARAMASITEALKDNTDPYEAERQAREEQWQINHDLFVKHFNGDYKQEKIYE